MCANEGLVLAGEAAGEPAADIRDRVTVAVTAFGSFAEMEAAMQGGYCPTLIVLTPTRRMSAAQREYEAAVGLLAGFCRASGFKVFDGRTVR